MHIAIIGAGISGLSLYLWLDHLSLTKFSTVTIYESRVRQNTGQDNEEDDSDSSQKHGSRAYSTDESNASLIGGALGLSAVGLKVLRRLGSDLEAEVKAAGHSIASWRMSSARGWELGAVESGKDDGGVLIARDELLRILRRRVPDAAVAGGKVKDVRVSKGEGGANVIVLEDGKEVEADLVVGCDGIWSRVRDAVLGEGREVQPKYEGLIGVGGFVPTHKLNGVPDGQMNVVFGRNGFFGYGYTSTSTSDPTTSPHKNQGAGWWSTYTLPALPKDWRTIPRSSIRTQILSRHTSWKNTVIHNILEDLDVESLSLYPTFTTPELPTWCREGVVLVGDAAHALQPSSGQGASMALEDCETLALLLSHYSPTTPSSAPRVVDEVVEVEHRSWLSKATQKYDEIRRPRLALVHKQAERVGAMKSDMGVLMEMVMYAFIYLSGKLGWAAKYNKALSEYDVPVEVARAVKRESEGKRKRGGNGTIGLQDGFGAVPT